MYNLQSGGKNKADILMQEIYFFRQNLANGVENGGSFAAYYKGTVKYEAITFRIANVDRNDKVRISYRLNLNFLSEL